MDKVTLKKVPPAAAAEEIAEKLNTYLQQGSVLLSLSGGSAIAYEIDILKSLASTDNLSVTLNDERYGLPGHDNSNWHQLRLGGLDASRFKTFEVLSGKDAPQTAAEFNNFLEHAVGQYKYLVSILGMGTDGHTSGVLPDSPAVKSSQLAVYYEAADFKRLTNTPLFLSQQTELWVLAYGQAKHDQIKLLEENLSVSVQPIQIIKKAASATFYNDLKGEV